MKYLGVTTSAREGEIQIVCTSEIEARLLAIDLRMRLYDANGLQLDGTKITYQGNPWLLKRFLISQNWSLSMDTNTRLVFNKTDQEPAGAAGTLQ